jgi:Spy/CpxP family protein refolding chaperone
MKTTTVIILLAFAVAIMPSCARQQETGGPSAMSRAGISSIFNFELNLTEAQKNKVKALLINMYMSNTSDINNFLKYAQPLVQAVTAKKYSKSKIENAYKKYSPYEKKMMVLLGKFYVDFYKILDNNQKKIMDDNIAQLLKILKDPYSLLTLFSSLPIENRDIAGQHGVQ